MITRDQIPAVLDHPVRDAEGSKIGDAGHVFFDNLTGTPEWVSVRTGLFGTNESFVPVRDATVVEDHLEVPYSKQKVKDAPNADVDAGGHLSEEEEHRLYDYYGIDWDEAGQRTQEPDSRGPDRTDAVPGTNPGTAGSRQAAGGLTGTGYARGETDSGGTPAEYDDASTTAGRSTVPGDAGGGLTGTGYAQGGTEDGVTGRARLRQYVAIEDEAGAERRPAADAGGDTDR